ncbi:zinc-finger domain-containing protein [Roseixanthobacter liquoris]|uniref:zinc-finger domain-containing protein n=1 Tax=Roseixanthobacter liquoris TaxID=3119921 RepID=UPI003726942A
MAAHSIPHFCNDLGVAVVEVGAKEFMCIGAKPPFDHPHIFIDMGDETEAVCSYCSTLYRHNPALHDDEAKPEGCVWEQRPVAA